jgi:hypothetical protein
MAVHGDFFMQLTMAQQMMAQSQTNEKPNQHLDNLPQSLKSLKQRQRFDGKDSDLLLC